MKNIPKTIEIRYNSLTDFELIKEIKSHHKIKTNTKLFSFLLNNYYKSKKEILSLKSKIIFQKLSK